MISLGLRIFIAFVVLGVVLVILPSAPLLPEEATNSISLLVSFLYDWDFIVPADTILAIFLLQIPLWTVYYSVHVIHWFSSHTHRGS